MKVLVLDAEQRSALAVTRSLGTLSDVEVTTVGESPVALSGCSRFSSRYVHGPSPEKEPERFVEWLAPMLEEESFNLVIPVTEITSQLLLMKARTMPELKLPFSDYGTLMELADKGKLIERSKRLKIPAPKSTWYPCAEDIDPDDLSFPLIVKPCLSRIYSNGRWIRTRVKTVKSVGELRKTIVNEGYLQSHPFMLQQFVPGKGAGVFCLYNHGEPVAFFAHKRLREKPPEGGVSVFSESAEVDSAMQAYAVKLLDSVGWHGVAMVEFRISPEGIPYLMEVNTRFWGSLQLAIDSGVDFPQLLWQIEQSSRSSDALASDYRIGQRLRWFLGDLDSLYLYFKGQYTVRQKAERLARFMTPSIKRCRHEVNRWDDLGPAWHELRMYINQLLGR